MSKTTPGSSKTKLAIRALRTNLGTAWKNDRRLLFKSVTAWVLFSGIIIVFIFLGQTPNRAGVATGAGAGAATVNGEIISLAEYNQQVEMLSRDPRFAQLEQFGGEFAKQMIRKRALDSLVDEVLLGENLVKLGMVTPDAQIRDTITSIPAFQDGDRFSKTRYLGYLQQTGQSAGDFEEKLRRQLAQGRVVRTFSAALRPIPLESEMLKSVESRRANVESLAIPTETLVKPSAVAAADVTAFLARPEGQARAKTYFDSHKSEFSTAEQAKVRHILIRADKTKPEEVAKAKTEIEKIAADIKGGANFEKLASEKSQDPGSKNKGGLIDYFAKGAMVPEFDAYAFSAKPGAVSDPIQSDFGFHLIRVEDRKAASEAKLETAEKDIAAKLIAEDRSRAEVAELEKALAAKDANASTFATNFAKKHGLSWTESGAFSITSDSVPKAGGGEEAVTEAFRLTAEKPVSAKLIRQGSQATLLRYRPVASESAKATATGTASPEYKAEENAARRINEAYGSWVDALRKSAKIAINPEVGARTAVN